MPIPIFFDSEAGKISLRLQAEQIANDINVIALRAREIRVEPKLNLKKAWQLILACRNFRAKVQPFLASGEFSGILEALARIYSDRTGTAVTAADVNGYMKALYPGTGDFLASAEPGFPLIGGERRFARLVANGNWQEQEIVEEIDPIPPGVLTLVNNLWVVFTG